MEKLRKHLKSYEEQAEKCAEKNTVFSADFVLSMIETLIDDVIEIEEREPETYGDEIRSMTDEKLADMLCFGRDCNSDNCGNYEKCARGINGMLEHLRTPIKKRRSE